MKKKVKLEKIRSMHPIEKLGFSFYSLNSAHRTQKIVVGGTREVSAALFHLVAVSRYFRCFCDRQQTQLSE